MNRFVAGWGLRYAALFLVFGMLILAVIRPAYSSPQVVKGKDGWLFLEQEIRFLNSGPFWGEHAMTVSRAQRDDAKDPTPAILAFHQALKAKNISLLLVPVPPKALLYPEYLPDDVQQSGWGLSLEKFYTLLREKGVPVLDLRDELMRQKKMQQQELYCQTDSHWSGYGVTVAATEIEKKIAGLIAGGSDNYTKKWHDIEIVGDLSLMLGEDQPKKETLSIREIMGQSGRPPEVDTVSPLLLLGDSHVLVFHDGNDMFARGAGISDQMALLLNRSVDVIGVRGSGATPARLSLYRKAQRNGDYWSGKKVVIWCFAAREFTETDGWRVVPIEPQ